MNLFDVIGKPQPKTWDDYEAGCLATYGGGYRTEAERDVFRHGMSTVFNLLRHEFPPAELCKLALALQAVCEDALDQLEHYQPQHAMDDQYASRVEALRDLLSQSKGTIT